MQPEPTPDPTVAELKKVVAFFAWQKKLTNRMLIGIAIAIPIAVVAAILVERNIDHEVNSPVPPPADRASWAEVDRALREGELAKAAERGETMIRKMPGYPGGHEKLGMVYVSTGELKKAEEHFAEAYRLLPTEANRQNLEAIRKRITEDK
jgi:cytochrome c-type biogenesis protein CcmH/NrfG